jgi:hypothetical protein
MQHHLLRRWLPIRARMKNVFNLVREEEVCINSKMLTAKVDLLIKRLEDQMGKKKEVIHIHDSHMTCKECGDTGHSGSNCPELQEDVNYINNNNNYRPQQNQGWNQ